MKNVTRPPLTSRASDEPRWVMENQPSSPDAGGVVVEVPTYEENAYRPDEQELRRVITSRTRAIIINTPCNPTGAAYDRDTLEMLAGIAKEFDLLVLADEIYTRYLYEGEFIPMRTLPPVSLHPITTRSGTGIFASCPSPMLSASA